MDMRRRRLLSWLAGALLGGSLFACSVVGLDEDPPPTEATIDGLQYTLSSRIRAVETFSGGIPISQIEGELAVENVSDHPISRTFGACPMNLRLYREGQWDEPVWDFLTALGARPDRGWVYIAIALGVQLKPDEREVPRFWDFFVRVPDLEGSDDITVASEITVEPGLYRVAATLHLNGDPANPKAQIVAPEPIRITPADLTVPSGRAAGG